MPAFCCVTKTARWSRGSIKVNGEKTKIEGKERFICRAGGRAPAVFPVGTGVPDGPRKFYNRQGYDSYPTFARIKSIRNGPSRTPVPTESNPFTGRR